MKKIVIRNAALNCKTSHRVPNSKTLMTPLMTGMETENSPPRAFYFCGMLLASVILAIGTAWAFQRGGGDFQVFYEAGRLVLAGRGREIYQATPDRFLYFPGFAWLFAPLTLLPKPAALALWCFIKAAVLGWTIREISCFFPRKFQKTVLCAGFWALIFTARPFLIDFQYGQVNVLILCFCILGLLDFFSVKESRSQLDDLKTSLYWFLATVAALCKLFPIPILLIPWLVPSSTRLKKSTLEQSLVIVSLLGLLCLPLLSHNYHQWWDLLISWVQAIRSKGFPIESHNQSFGAFLSHYFSGNLTPIILMGPTPVSLTWIPLQEGVLQKLTLAWGLIWIGWLSSLLLIFFSDKQDKTNSKENFHAIALLLASLILPLHLIWKPYFVMTFPMVLSLLLHRIPKWAFAWGPLWFFVFNLTGPDFLSAHLAGRLEAFSIMMWAHLFLLLKAK